MRDPKRIKEILLIIERIWNANPDLRFNQLIYLLQSEYSEANDQLGKVESEDIEGFKKIGYDLFNLDDDQFQKYLTTSVECGRWGENT